MWNFLWMLTQLWYWKRLKSLRIKCVKNLQKARSVDSQGLGLLRGQSRKCIAFFFDQFWPFLWVLLEASEVQQVVLSLFGCQGVTTHLRAFTGVLLSRLRSSDGDILVQGYSLLDSYTACLLVCHWNPGRGLLNLQWCFCNRCPPLLALCCVNNSLQNLHLSVKMSSRRQSWREKCTSHALAYRWYFEPLELWRPSGVIRLPVCHLLSCLHFRG